MNDIRNKTVILLEMAGGAIFFRLTNPINCILNHFIIYLFGLVGDTNQSLESVGGREALEDP